MGLEETSKKEDLKKEFAKDTTFHGIPDALRESNVMLKIAWSILLAVSWSILLRSSYNTLMEYLSQPTSATVIRFTPEAFPTLVYCPGDWVSPMKAATLRLTTENVAFFYGVFFTNPNKLLPISNNYKVNVAAIKNAKFSDTIDELAMALSKDVDDVVFKYIAPIYSPVKPWKIVNSQGVCFVYEQAKGITDINSKYAAILMEFKGNKQRISGTSDFLDSWFFGGWGMAPVPYSGISLKPGYNYGIRVHVTKLASVSTRKRVCDQKGTARGQMSCLMAKINQMCSHYNAVVLYYPNVSLNIADVGNRHFGQSLCSRVPQVKGVLDVDDSLGCNPPCRDEILVATAFHVKTDPSANLTVVKITFANPNYAMYYKAHMSYTYDSLISKIGGIMSLWSGASVITLLQVFCFFGRHAYKGNLKFGGKKPIKEEKS